MMKKSKFIAVIPVLFTIEGAFLMIYGFATGASFVAIVNVFLSTSSSVSVKEFYVMIGLLRTMIASLAIKEEKPITARTRRTWSERTKMSTKRATMIVCGVFFVCMSISGVVYSLSVGGITASNAYGIVIEFIVTFISSLSYLIYAFRIKVPPL